MTVHELAAPRVYRGKALRYNSAMLVSRHLVDSLRPPNCNPAEGWSYGLFEVRARLPRSTDAAPGFWLWGGAPDEVDIFEGNADVVASNFHYLGRGYWRSSRLKEQECQCFFYNTDPAANLNGKFHTYGLSWLPNELIFYFDGLPIRHETRSMPAGCAMFLILHVAAVAWAKVPTDTMAVDYLRVYRPRHLPVQPPVLRPGAYLPSSEDVWMPSEIRPGQFEQDSHQGWQLTRQPRFPYQLTLLLTENYNPPCAGYLPLPLNGHWAPTWAQTHGTPELRVQALAPDSVHWAVRDLQGRAVASGVAAGGGTWRPQLAELPPGTYAMHLRQGLASVVQPLAVMGRPAGSQPTAEWQQPVLSAAPPE